MPPSPSPDLESTHVVQRRAAVTLVVRRDWLSFLPMEALLAGAPLGQWGRPVADHGLTGRGSVHVLETAGGELVAKRLSRGGWLGRWLPGLYLDHWRPAREALLVERLATLGVPTAPVVVARSTRVLPGLSRCELATVRLPGAIDLLAALLETPLEGWCELAGAAGRTLARLHDVGLAHRDLQVKNLLVPANDREGWDLLPVIDLDGSALRGALDTEERLRALTRFARSLVKRQLLPRRGAVSAGLPAGAIRAFVTGYGFGAGPGRAALLRSLSRRLARQVAVHGLFWPRSHARNGTAGRR
jgi:hypothetical protein